MLDRLAGQKPQLSFIELTLLVGAVIASATSPHVLNGRITEFIAPSAAAFTAAIGIAAEYTGRVAVADGKEVAAASLQCAAEAEGFLAAAERAKAVRSVVKEKRLIFTLALCDDSSTPSVCSVNYTARANTHISIASPSCLYCDAVSACPTWTLHLIGMESTSINDTYTQYTHHSNNTRLRRSASVLEPRRQRWHYSFRCSWTASAWATICSS